MASDLESARDDLAYMRSLVSGTGPMQATIGEAFFWAGAALWRPVLLALAADAGPAAVRRAWSRLAIVVRADGRVLRRSLAMIIWKDRKTPPGGVASRALGAVFQGAGIANLVMAFVFAYGAARFESFGLWLYHPIVVCMFQGVAWYRRVG